MEPKLIHLTGAEHQRAFAQRLSLLDRAVAENARGIHDIGALRRYLAERTICVTMLAGAGTRWVKSIKDAEARGECSGFDPEKPRGLFPVRNVLGSGPARIPIAAYSLDAVKDLGDHLIIVRGYEEEIESTILRPLGYDAGSYRFATQEVVNGKPLGHGDAARQTAKIWSKYEYIFVNFGGDASSPRTAFSALAVLDTLISMDESVDLLMPVARFDAPAYPVTLDARGFPTSFGHAKLQGASVEAGPGYANVGVRLYRTAALARVVDRVASTHYKPGIGYAIPGNDPAGREFALDNVDADLAAAGRARILASALPEELTPVKAVEDVPRFEAAIAAVRADAR